MMAKKGQKFHKCENFSIFLTQNYISILPPYRLFVVNVFNNSRFNGQ